MKRIETKGSKVKKLVGLGLSLGLLFALTGCGKQPAAAAQASDAQTSDVQTKESTEVKEEPEVIFEELDKSDIISSSAVELFGSDIVEME